MSGETTNYADTVAPAVLYSEIPRTAENVIRRSIVQAIQAETMMELPEVGPDDETREQKIARYLPFHEATYRMMFHASTADMLMRLQALDSAAADAAAAHQIEAVEDGSYWPEMLYDWALARSINPDQIRIETEAVVAASKEGK